jgi:hypothetical protein
MLSRNKVAAIVFGTLLAGLLVGNSALSQVAC